MRECQNDLALFFMTQRQTIVATCFDRKGRVLGTGVNDYYRSHPLQKYFSIKAGLSADRIYIHAELAAVLASGKKRIHSIFVQRFGKRGDMLNAKPCKSCMLMLKFFDVKIVRYTHHLGIQTEHI